MYESEKMRKVTEVRHMSHHAALRNVFTYCEERHPFMLLFATYTYHWRIGSGFGLLCVHLKHFFCLLPSCTPNRALPELIRSTTSFPPSLLATRSHRIRSINRKRRTHTDERLSTRIRCAARSNTWTRPCTRRTRDARAMSGRSRSQQTRGYLPVLLHRARKEKAVCGLALRIASEPHSHGHHHDDVVARIDAQPK